MHKIIWFFKNKYNYLTTNCLCVKIKILRKKGKLFMEIFLAILLFLVGVVLIVKGGDFFVDSASWIAKVSGIPEFIIGATIVSIATTLPELLVSVMAAVQGKVDMATGNAVGSVTVNVGIIMALSILCMPSVIKRKDYMFKSITLMVSAGIICICGFVGEVNVILSIVLLAIFVTYMAENVVSAKRSLVSTSGAVIKNLANESPVDLSENATMEMQTQTSDVNEKKKISGKEIAINITKFIVGAVAIVYGADLLVDKGSLLAEAVGISERIISLTLIAIGTSLPELVTTITAISKKQSSLSLGNIIGANILDLTLIMPLCSIISGQSLPIAKQAGLIDLPVCLAVCMLALIPSLISGKFKRWQGVTLMAFYLIYLVVTCLVVIV